MSRIAIIGAGAWGTALSIVAGRKGCHEVWLWAYEAEVREAIASGRINSIFLPGHRVPECVRITGDLSKALTGAGIVVTAVPSQHYRDVFRQASDYLMSEMLIVSATKGLEQGTLFRMTQVAGEITNHRCEIGALSGPSFAAEVARGDPTAITIASRSRRLTEIVQRDFSDLSFRIYSNADVIGVELGGALKNVIAIAAGVCNGLGLGYNSIAGLITRGLAEMTRLVIACGGRAETMSGLAGLGDLVLTCTGELSRNRSVGVELGRGRKLTEIVSDMQGKVAEGVSTTDAAVRLAQAHGVEMPITEQMHAILNRGKSPREAIHELMMRSSKDEIAARQVIRE